MKVRFRTLCTVFSVLSLLLLVLCCATPHASNGSREVTIIGTADLQGQLEPAVMKVDLDGDHFLFYPCRARRE
jgi:hypothetical protein